MEDIIVALAASGAGALLSAAGTDAWNTAREGITRLYSRRGAKAVTAIDGRLDELAGLASLDDDAATQARISLLPKWAGRLEDLLEEHPDGVGDLQALVMEIESLLPRNQSTHYQQKVRAEDHGRVWAVNHGDMNIYHAEPHANADKSSARIHYFALGCAIGNALALLPVSDGREDTVFEEFIEALHDTGADRAEIKGFQDLRHIISSPLSSSEDIRRALEDYGKAIQVVVANARKRAAAEEFRWLTVGRLLYGITIHQFLPDEADRACQAERRALSGIASSMDMPQILRDEFVAFASTLPGDASATLLKANEIAQTCYAFL